MRLKTKVILNEICIQEVSERVRSVFDKYGITNGHKKAGTDKSLIFWKAYLCVSISYFVAASVTIPGYNRVPKVAWQLTANFLIYVSYMQNHFCLFCAFAISIGARSMNVMHLSPLKALSVSTKHQSVKQHTLARLVGMGLLYWQNYLGGSKTGKLTYSAKDIYYSLIQSLVWVMSNHTFRCPSHRNICHDTGSWYSRSIHFGPHFGLNTWGMDE